MEYPYYILYDDLRRRNITVDIKDLSYVVLDNSISGRFVKAIRKFDELLNEFSKEYEKDLFDCDDFSILFKAVCGLYGFACGYAEGRVYLGNQFYGLHAFNVIPYVIDSNLTWLVVEPQVVGVMGCTWFNTFDIGVNKARMLGLYTYEVNYVWI